MKTLAQLGMLLCAAVLLVLATGCFTPQAHFRYETPPQEKSVVFGDASIFEAKLPSGSLSIEGWDKPTVEMTAEVWAKGIFAKSAERLAKDTRVDLVKEGDKVIIKVQPAVSMVDSERVGADIVVHVPAKAVAQATATYATVSAKDMAGAVKLDSTYGNITLANLCGPADCRSTYGNIKIASGTAGVNLCSTYGNIHLTDVAGAIAARTTYGNVALIDPRDKVDCNTTYGDISVTAKSGCWKGENVKVKTTYGDIKVTLATEGKPKP